MANQGTPGIWVDFVESHSVGTYHVYNPKTKKFIFTKYVTILQKSFKDWGKVEKPVMVPPNYEDDEDNK